MAKKTYRVIDGALQEGRLTYVKGQEYSPPNKDIEDELLAAGKIAPLGNRAAAQDSQPPAQDDD
ncbi:hypothetical protein [Atopomonas sediminilitoris]|uniref:hypothetical protein n=1 Tax=Atopomonas sediminilitoris TaxID=2919919 RepID=UPI001F4DEE80|nr:hypothetical protein [Atopomonas sediminilitoris]MCJ8168637.1 hypothetical protein [Atopomonas sediminilitoris]